MPISYTNFNLSASLLPPTIKYDPLPANSQQAYKPTILLLATALGISAITSQLGNLSANMFGDEESGRAVGAVFSSGVSSLGDTLANNLLKGQALTQGLGLNVGSSVAGAAIGIGANYLGKGITSAMGDSKAGRALGAGTSTLVGNVGGTIATNLIKNIGASAANKVSALSGLTSGTSIGGLAGQVVGSALSAANGPSHEYLGKYGGITRGMDTGYDMLQTAIGFVPGWGQLAAGAMALNKGMSNLFGSTSGMTKQDAILGSAFMPAPVKWLNMAGAKTTDTFKNLSWQNTERTNSFMQDAFGNLGEKFAKAREEAGKTYGTFSRKAYNKAQNNLDYANLAWGKILQMTNLNEYLNIRSHNMVSINNLKYELDILGGYNPIARGKYGMKLLSFQVIGNTPDIGMRLLSRVSINNLKYELDKI